ncbi:MAG TPA: hypothetical protein VFQ58_02445, partial [Flavisolibacter sp.]|nr:hypothetical protein [Flavisolibacter sp.]
YKYLRWSINAVLRWQNEYRPERFTHMHGTSDKILPVKYTLADIRIRNGGHLMVYNRSAEVSEFINKIIKDIKA